MVSNAVLHLLSNHLRQPITTGTLVRVSGGSINDSYRISLPANEHYFCKINSATKFPHLFQKEQQGLEFIAQQQVISTPQVVLCAETENEQVLLLRWIENCVPTKAFWQQFGQKLAAMHTVTNPLFGWSNDNYMGSVVQQNSWQQDWCSFFARQRLWPLTVLCMQQRLLTKEHGAQMERLILRLPQIFEPEPPALVHGDLWSGNFLCQHQQPVLIDPAVYFGHRSVDLAMTTLFGGFDSAFYDAYHFYAPFPSNYKEQWAVCNVYPLLIHLLLFGPSYRGQIEAVLNHYD